VILDRHREQSDDAHAQQVGVGVEDISARRSRRRAERLRLFESACWALWIALTVVSTILALLHPNRSIFYIYRAGVERWWAGAEVYSAGIHGYLYLPASIFLFSPFAALGTTWGDVAWRIVSVALFTYGLWRLVRLMAPAQARLAMAVLLILLLPTSGTDIQRSQAGVAMAALMFIAGAEAAEARWTRAAVWLCLGLALKPLVVVLLLLYGALMPQLRWRLLIGLAVVLALPFIHPHPAYVAGEYAAFVDKLMTAAAPGTGRWNEFAMMLQRFGVDVPEPAQTAVRALAALATLAVATIAVRRLALKEAAIALLALAIAYLLVFDPRTELGGYMDLAAIAGLYLMTAWNETPRRDGVVVFLAALIIGLGTQAYGDWIYRLTDVWLKPALGLMFLGYLGQRILRSPARAPASH